MNRMLIVWCVSLYSTLASAKASDTLTPAESKLIATETKRVIGHCLPDCAPASVDLKAETARVRAGDIQKRDQAVAELVEEAEESQNLRAGSSFGRTVAFCKLKTPPAIEVDAGVVVFFAGIQRPLPMEHVFLEMGASCGNPESIDNQQFMQKVKVVHFKLVPPHKPTAKSRSNYDPEEYGYEYAFDAKTGTLTVGTWEGTMDKEWFKIWVAKQ